MRKNPLILAGLAAILSVCAARADDRAYANGPTVLRSAPDTQAHVIKRVDANTEFAIDHCSKGWCYAHVGRDGGYVAESVLSFNDGQSSDHVVVERTYVDPDYVYPGYYYPGYVYGPGIYVGGGWHGGWHGGHYWRH
jgi:hypothetical protein